MIVLGISETHCATAALLRDGRIIGCASEERFSRLKNDAGYPRLAVNALLQETGVAPAEIDVVALAGARAAAKEWLNRVLHDPDYIREYYGVAWPSPRRTLGKRVRKWGAKFGLMDASRGQVRCSSGCAPDRGRESPGPPGLPHRLPGPSPLPCRRRLLRIRLRRARGARSHQRQFGRRPLCHRLHRTRARPRAARGHAPARRVRSAPSTPSPRSRWA